MPISTDNDARQVDASSLDASTMEIGPRGCLMGFASAQPILRAMGCPCYVGPNELFAPVPRLARGVMDVKDFDGVRRDPIEYLVRISAKGHDAHAWTLC
jgi:hypothetical protein